MEISAWDIYWVMQLDTLINVAGILTVVGGVGLVFAYGLAFGDRVLPKSLPLAATPFWILAAATCAFLPSSKTAAAMIVLPAIVNNESVQTEAGELYGLAKDALRKVGAEESKGESDE